MAARGVLLAVVLAAALATVVADADITYYEPDLRLEYSDRIHPYAYAHRMPVAPTVQRDGDVESLVEIQDHVMAGSEAAKRLTVSPEYVQSLDGDLAPPEMMPAQPELIELEVAKKKGGKKGKGGGKKGAAGFSNDPATEDPLDIKPNGSPFYVTDNVDAAVFKNSYRRAVYGLRRRRMPLTQNALTYTLNPFRRPMNFHVAPSDVMFPRQRIMQALNPQLTDIAKFGGPGALPYGGFSSFRPANPDARYRVFRHQEPAPGTVGGLGVFRFPSPIPGFGQQESLHHSDGRQLPVAHPFPVSPYVPTMGKFFDFYGGGGKK